MAQPKIPTCQKTEMRIFLETASTISILPKPIGQEIEHILPDSPNNTKNTKDFGTSQRSEMCIFLETVPEQPRIPKPMGQNMSMFFETVQKQQR